MTDGTMIDVGALSGVIDADRSSGLVKVGAGTVLADLNEELHRLGLAMENLGDIDRQTVAGAISTGTHGTGAKLRNISSQVEAMELVLADGSRARAERRRRSRAAARGAGGDRRPRRDHGGDAALRARLHPAPGRLALPREEVLDSFQQRADAHEHFELFTFPYADSALVLERNRTEGPPRPRGKAAAFLNDVVARELGAGGDLRRRQGSSRAAIPSLSRLAAWLASRQQVDRSQRPDLRQRAPRPLHRDGVRGAARARSRGGAPGDRVGALQPLPGLLPDRDAGDRRPTTPCSAPRTSATPPTSPSTSTAAWSGAPTSRRSRRS